MSSTLKSLRYSTESQDVSSHRMQNVISQWVESALVRGTLNGFHDIDNCSSSGTLKDCLGVELNMETEV